MRIASWALAAVACGPALLAATPAEATRCLYPERAVTGAPRNSMTAAQNSAIAAWQKAVQRNKGSRYANWYYSGDRTIACRWNDRGTMFRCQASAVPCGE
jgi:hypothetical protein